MTGIKKLLLLVSAFLCYQITTKAQQETVRNNNAFALDFYSQWRKQTDKNIVISPFSMSTALAMTYPGARNATAGQMITAMRFHENAEQQSRDFHGLLSNINAAGSPMTISNIVWMQKGFSIEQTFRTANTQYFGSGFREVNFAGAPDSTRMAINKIIEVQTKGKIKNLLPQGSVNSLTRLVLANAIYFKDGWAKRFDTANTKPRDFFLSPEEPVKAQFMEMRDVEFNYTENDVATIVELPYQNDRFTMLILLPKRDVHTLEASLNISEFSSWNFSKSRFRTLQIPRFKIEHEVQPVAIIKQFGMKDAFQAGQADFSGISKEARLFISGIYHKAFIEVNEEGTEAAAATAVVAQADSISERPSGIDFIANKPFLFILRDRISNSIVFIGKVKNPTQ